MITAEERQEELLGHWNFAVEVLSAWLLCPQKESDKVALRRVLEMFKTPLEKEGILNSLSYDTLQRRGEGPTIP